MPAVNAPFELKDYDQKGGFKGYVSVFGNEDLGDDVMLEGCFKKFKTTSDGHIRIALQHDIHSKLAGKAKHRQDSYGLHLEGKLILSIPYVKDAHELMKEKILDGMSVGFGILPDGYHYAKNANDREIRYISAAELWEGSIVTFGMNPKAKVTEVKNYSIEDIRNLESIARSNGCSRKQATNIASLFKKSLSDSGLYLPQSDSEIDCSRETLDEFKSLFENFKR